MKAFRCDGCGEFFEDTHSRFNTFGEINKIVVEVNEYSQPYEFCSWTCVRAFAGAKAEKAKQ